MAYLLSKYAYRCIWGLEQSGIVLTETAPISNLLKIVWGNKLYNNLIMN